MKSISQIATNYRLEITVQYKCVQSFDRILTYGALGH